MSLSESLDVDPSEVDEPGDLRFLLSEYSAVVSFLGVVLGFALIGYVIDIIAGPLSQSTLFAHRVAGLFGGVAVVLFVCGVVIALTWMVLIVSNR